MEASALPRVSYTRRLPNRDAFERPRVLSRAAERAGFPSVSVDARGHVHVLWERDLAQDANGRRLGYASSSDGGATFAEAVEVPHIAHPSLGANGSQQGKLVDKLAVDEDGTLAVVNSTFDPARGSHIWLVRGSPRRSR
jgi:hypothetical protein